jgi:hypothetical protein
MATAGCISHRLVADNSTVVWPASYGAFLHLTRWLPSAFVHLMANQAILDTF